MRKILLVTLISASASPALAQPVAPPAPVPAALPKKMAVGKVGTLQIGALLQGWYQLDRTSDATTSTFRLRRAEINVKGEILPKRVAFKVMVDPAKVRETTGTKLTDGTGATVTIQQPVSKISVLQDVEITYLSKYADVSIGQFKNPVSWEGYNSAAKLLFPERAVVSQKYGDFRDLGVKVAKTMPTWGYVLGLYNGTGANNFDNNNQKDIALRLEAYPVEGLTLAAVTYDSIGYRNRTGTKDRWEGDVRYERGPLLLQAEFIHARDCTAASCADVDPVDAQGFYGAIAYTLEGKALHGQLQPILRVGYLDEDTSQDLAPVATGDKDELFHYDVGLNYYLQGHEMKLQASYQRTQFQDSDVKPATNEVVAAAQVWF